MQNSSLTVSTTSDLSSWPTECWFCLC